MNSLNNQDKATMNLSIIYCETIIGKPLRSLDGTLFIGDEAVHDSMLYRTALDMLGHELDRSFNDDGEWDNGRNNPTEIIKHAMAYAMHTLTGIEELKWNCMASMSSTGEVKIALLNGSNVNFENKGKRKTLILDNRDVLNYVRNGISIDYIIRN